MVHLSPNNIHKIGENIVIGDTSFLFNLIPKKNKQEKHAENKPFLSSITMTIT